MDRIKGTDVDATTPPSPPTEGVSGYPRVGTPGGPAATKFDPYFLHMLVEEVRNVITSAGLTPDFTALNQLQAAIAKQITESKTAATEAASGVVELATSAETVTGTDSSRACHPAGVKAAIDAMAASVVPALTAGDIAHFIDRLSFDIAAFGTGVPAAEIVGSRITVLRHGTIRISYTATGNSAAEPVFGAIFKNGVALTWDGPFTDTGPHLVSHDIDVAANDIIGIGGKKEYQTNPGSVYGLTLSAAETPFTIAAQYRG